MTASASLDIVDGMKTHIFRAYEHAVVRHLTLEQIQEELDEVFESPTFGRLSKRAQAELYAYEDALFDVLLWRSLLWVKKRKGYVYRGSRKPF